MNKDLKLSLCLAVLLSIFLLSCGGGGGGPGPNPETSNAKWTIVAYLDGNIDLDAKKGVNASFILDELHDFEDIGSTDDVQIIALYASIKENGVGRYYHIEYYPNDTSDEISSPTVSELGSVDMSDYRVLRDLINEAVEKYPADRYMLYGSGHGGGWRGVFPDEIQASRPYGMSMDEFSRAITESAVDKFDITVFNACLMSMVEVGYQLRTLTDYIVASQVSISADNVIGLGEWLQNLNDDPDMLTQEVAVSIATASYNEVRSRNVGDKVTFNHSISVLNVDEGAFETFSVKWIELHNAIIDNIDLYYSEMLNARAAVHDSGLDLPDYIDVILYLEELIQQPNISNTQQYVDLIDEMLEILKEDIRVVVYNNLTQEARRDGIAIYFPAFCEQNTAVDIDLYDKVDFCEKTDWGDHATAFVQILIEAGITTCPSDGQPGEEQPGNDQQGELAINSTPAGASITINGTDQGAVTPMTYTADPGQYTVTLTLSGYQNWEQTVPVTAGQTTTVNATMAQAQATINEQEPNDGLNQAQSIPVPSLVNGIAKNSDSGFDLGGAGNPVIVEDWFQFTISATSPLSITLSTNNMADFDFYLLDANLDYIDQAIDTGTGDEVFSGNLAAGSYYIGVSAYDNATDINYTLTLNQ